jgi:hypothetical protein
VDVNLKVALVLVVGFAGFAVIVVSGGVVSTVHVLAFAGDVSVFPAGSVARTWNACFPSSKVSEVHGLVQDANTPLSTLHSKVLPASVEVKEKVALGLFVNTGGLEVMVVFGAFVSIVQSKLAGVGSVLPPAVARTLKL